MVSYGKATKFRSRGSNFLLFNLKPNCSIESAGPDEISDDSNLIGCLSFFDIEQLISSYVHIVFDAEILLLKSHILMHFSSH